MEAEGGPTVLSLFTGAGGLDLGLEAAGMRCIGTVESDRDARATVAGQRPEWTRRAWTDVEEAARSLTREALEVGSRGLDVLAGAPPCQPYSKAADATSRGPRGVCDPRSVPLLQAWLGLVERLTPRALVLENVRAFTRGPQSAAPLLRAGLEEIRRRTGVGYRWSEAVLHAEDYGVPQRRRRSVVVAMREGSAFSWPAPTHMMRPIRAWDALHDAPAGEAPRARGRYADLLPSIPEGGNYLHLTERGAGPALFAWRSRFWTFLLKLAKDRPAWTITAQPGPATGPFHWSSRPLSPAEALRLQGFPHGWRLAGGRRSQRRQAGNATPPLLAEHVGRALRSQLGWPEERGPMHLHIEHQPRIPPPEAPQPVPRHYLEGGRQEDRGSAGRIGSGHGLAGGGSAP